MSENTNQNINQDMNRNTPDSTEVLFKKLKKEMRINRTISCINLVMTTIILVIVILAFVEMKQFIAEVEPVIEVLSEVDIDALNAFLIHFNSIIETLKIDELMNTISSINFEGINEVMEGLDIDQLTETLENINEGAERLDKIGDWIENSPFNIFGFGSE